MLRFTKSGVLIARLAVIEGESQTRLSPDLADPVLQELGRVGESVPFDQVILEAARTAFPKHPGGLPLALRPFWKVGNDLWADDGLVMKGHSIVIPAAKRADVQIGRRSPGTA